MAEDAILTSRDKEILQDGVDPGEIKDVKNRRYKIRTRVRNRSETLVDEIGLLLKSGEKELVDEFLQTLSNGVDGLHDSNIRDRVDRLRKDLDEAKRKHEELAALDSRLKDIEEELGMA